jgi:RHS repeat-associated protein
VNAAFQTALPEHLPLAASPQLAENSRLGFRPVASTSRWGFSFSISSYTLGLSGSLYDGRVGSCSTGKERDAESGNDYFEARYYSSAMGRFLSPDWSAKEDPIPYAKLDDPQSLNLYAYVRNNPLSRTDPDGHQEPQPPTITCTGTAYVLAGNPRNVGHEGAPGVTVTNGSAAVVPRQWTGADGMGPTLRTIGAGTTGTVTGPNGQKESFSTLTQPVGEASLGTAKQAQDTVMARAPGALVIEIVGGKDFGTKANVTLTMPNLGQSCPTGTTQVPAPKPAPAPAPAPTPPPPPVRPPAH